MQKQTSPHQSRQQGQALVEYTLIVTLVILAFVVAIAATGPAIGNVFSNTVYNLLGTNPEDIEDLPDKEAFWLTVTWVSQQTPVEAFLPTRTPVPNTEVPTDGPSPSPTPVTPTNTPVPTSTPEATATPRDFEFVAPWHDSADEEEHWRLGDGIFLGADEGWYAEYFTDEALTSSSSGGYTSEIDLSKTYVLDYDWNSGSPIDGWPAGDEGNHFGISFRRHIYLDADQILTFKVSNLDDGVRVWLLNGHGDITTTRPGNCSSTGVNWGGNPSGSGSATTYGGTSTDCLLIDGWKDVSGNVASVTRTVLAGGYTLVVDYYDSTGNASIKLDIEAAGLSGNPDDVPVDSGGNPQSGAADCRWGNVEDIRDSNSPDFRWDSWEDGMDFGIGNRCYLELRGSVEIPAGMIDPVLSFWDIWDFRDPSMDAWVEVAEYDPDNDSIFDRADLSWSQQTLHVGNSTNYNWTYQEIDLRTLLGLTGANTMEGKKYAIRFGMEVPTASYSTGNDRGYRLWWVDSINVDVAPKKTFYTAQLWDLDTPEQANDFITSGRWSLSSANPRGGSGSSWDDSDFSDYEITNLDGCGASGSNCSNYDDQNLRMHSLEFNGIIDLNDPLGVTDLEGDGGDAILSFWHAYDLDRYTGLEVQYTTDVNYDSGAAPIWKLIPGGDLVVRDSSARPTQGSMVFEELNLDDLQGLEPAANGQFRIRFVMTGARWSSTDPGWWIDDIQLERNAISSFLPYPFIETMEDEGSMNDWLLGGNWGRTDHRAWRPESNDNFSLTDSPATKDGGGSFLEETFNTNQTTTVEARLAFDVNNDSPLNPLSPACALIPSTLCDEPDNATPIDPIMTFQWWHDFGSSGGEDFYVEWQKADDSDNVWKELWAYRDRMAYNTSSDSSTRRQWNWQRVEIDLREIWASSSFDNGLPDSATDDDILFRFRFETNSNNNNADGVFIDEIRIEERTEQSWALWDEGVDEEVDTPSFPTNQPLIYTTGDFRYIRMVAESSLNGQDYAGGAEFNLMDKDGNDIPRAGWTVDFVDSEQTSSYVIDRMLDGNANTFWHTQWSPTRDAYPHEFRIDLGADYQVGFFKYLPRQDHTNTRIGSYKFYVSTNGSSWQLAKQGSLVNTTSEQTVTLQIDYTTNSGPSGGGGSSETVTGDGVSYRDNLDDRANEIFDNWYLGGEWNVIEWEQYDGVLAFHDSTATPLNSSGDPETPPPNPTDYTRQNPHGFNVLEMSTIIDLRATNENRQPIMTFWQRHHIGSSTSIRVQVALEDTDTIGDGSYCYSSTLDQCYDHYYGWSEWQTAPPWNQGGFDDWDQFGNSYQYVWKREIVDLSQFAADSSNPGKRIRIRFISDSMDRGPGDSNLNDGWYIDNIEFKYNVPSVVNIDVDTGDSFFDAARNTRNWIMEGTWGLSPEFFRGSGGGPADFGGKFWDYWLYDMRDCGSNSAYENCVKNRFNSWQDPDDGAARLIRKGLALDINNDWGSGGPNGVTYKFAGIWELETPVIGTTMVAGNYTFVFTYDEGLRAKFDSIPAGNLPSTAELPDPYDPEWNIYNDFKIGGRQVGVGNALFENGEQYKLRFEFFEQWNDAAFIVSLGSSSFSFTDSPKQASGAAFPERPAAPRSESSMIFNGVFDLKDAVAPIIQYYTYHELGGAGRVEITRDGGFQWRTDGLRGSTPAGFWTSDWDAEFWDDEGRGNDKMAYDSGTGTWQPGVYPPAHSIPSYATDDLDFDWGSNQTPVNGWTRANGSSVRDDWSAQFRRSFTLPTSMEITFRITSDDGHRLWLNLNGTGYFPQCHFLDNDPNKPLVSGKPRVSGENDEVIGGTSGSCLLISDWEDGGNNIKEVTRTVPAGNHELILDYYENGGGAKVKYEMFAGNFDQPFYGGTYMPDDGDWRQKVHSLSLYAGRESDGDPKPPIGIRFRLDRMGESETSNYEQASNQSPVNWMESWWITDITVQDTVSGP